MTRNGSWIILHGGLVLLVAVCGRVGASGLPDESPRAPGLPLPQSDARAHAAPPQRAGEPDKVSTQMTRRAEPASSSAMESLIDKAKQDLARRLSIATSQISLVEAREVVWPDSSLGCPQPGMRYKQVPEDGALIVLQARGAAYEYHNGGARGLFLCENAGPVPKKRRQIDITDRTPPKN